MNLAARRRLVVALGGVAGSLLRIVVDDVLASGDAQWPWGTFVVNVGGALLLGYFFTRLVLAAAPTTLSIPFLCVGFLGALTTFSTFALEVFRLGDGGRVGLAAGYAGMTIVIGLAAAAVGIAVAERRP